VYLGLAASLVGAALAIGAAVTSGLLLYSGDGLPRALAAVTAIMAGSLATGLSVGIPREDTFKVVLRRRWRTALLAYGVAVLYATAWSFMGDDASRPQILGIGLAFLGALPCLGAGMVLGASAQVHEWIDPPASTPFAWAAFGFAFGALLAGSALGGARFLPPTLMMLCVVFLSTGSLIQALGIRALEVRWVPMEEPRPPGDRVEERDDEGAPASDPNPGSPPP